jgi:hypothetical protein
MAATAGLGFLFISDTSLSLPLFTSAKVVAADLFMAGKEAGRFLCRCP